MTSHKRSLVLLLGSFLAACSPAGEDAMDEDFGAAADDLTEDRVPLGRSFVLGGAMPADGLRPGDRVVGDRIAAVVPERGASVTAVTEYDTGHSRSLTITTGMDGIARVETAVDAERAEAVTAAAAATTGACSDGAYSLYNYRWGSSYNWYFSSGTTPSYLSVSSSETALRAAASTIVTSGNDCGFSDAVSATSSYRGRTTRGVNVRSDGTCGTRDGYNVAGFGAMSNGALAITCTWSSNGQALESDVRINKNFRFFNGSAPSGCDWKFSLRAVMTHEFGHTFGLGHVSETYHPALTMSTNITECSTSASTLGRGDVLGLRVKY